MKINIIGKIYAFNFPINSIIKFIESDKIDICNDCNTTLVFRLILKDSEDNKTKKLYICLNCGKYSFIGSEE